MASVRLRTNMIIDGKFHSRGSLHDEKLVPERLRNADHVIAVPHLSLIGEWEYFANIPVYSQWREKFSSSEAIMGGKAVRDRPLSVELFFSNNNLGRAIA